MLLVVIVALGIALVIQHRKVTRLQAELIRKDSDLNTARKYVDRIKDLEARLLQGDPCK
jgi:hypothetical protein